LVHQFNPNEVIEWFNVNLKIRGKAEFRNIQVREMEFDLLTDIVGIRDILEFESNQLEIFQFSKQVPGTLQIERLPVAQKMAILKENGLLSLFSIDFGMLSIFSFDEGFLKAIRENPNFCNRILEREKWVKGQSNR